MRRPILLGLIAALFLAACQPALPAVPTDTATPVPSATLSPTATQTPLPSATTTASPTPTASATRTPVPSATASATRTATPDIYTQAALVLDDLPNGFIPLGAADLAKLHLTEADIAQAFGSGFTEAQLHNVAAYLFPKKAASQIVLAFLFYPLSDLELHNLDTGLFNPQAVADAMLGASASTGGLKPTVRVIKGLEGLGHARLGITVRSPQPTGPALRWDLTIVRRGRIAEFVLSLYPDTPHPSAGIIDLAQKLDGRVADAQAPK